MKIFFQIIWLVALLALTAAIAIMSYRIFIEDSSQQDEEVLEDVTLQVEDDIQQEEEFEHEIYSRKKNYFLLKYPSYLRADGPGDTESGYAMHFRTEEGVGSWPDWVFELNWYSNVADGAGYGDIDSTISGEEFFDNRVRDIEEGNRFVRIGTSETVVRDVSICGDSSKISTAIESRCWDVSLEDGDGGWIQVRAYLMRFPGEYEDVISLLFNRDEGADISLEEAILQELELKDPQEGLF